MHEYMDSRAVQRLDALRTQTRMLRVLPLRAPAALPPADHAYVLSTSANAALQLLVLAMAQPLTQALSGRGVAHWRRCWRR